MTKPFPDKTEVAFERLKPRRPNLRNLVRRLLRVALANGGRYNWSTVADQVQVATNLSRGRTWHRVRRLEAILLELSILARYPCSRGGMRESQFAPGIDMERLQGMLGTDLEVEEPYPPKTGVPCVRCRAPIAESRGATVCRVCHDVEHDPHLGARLALLEQRAAARLPLDRDLPWWWFDRSSLPRPVSSLAVAGDPGECGEEDE